MSLTNILREVNAYLLRLEQARDLLAESMLAEHPAKPARRSSVTRARRPQQIRLNTARTARKAEDTPRKVNRRSPEATTASQALPAPDAPQQSPQPILHTASLPVFHEKKRVTVPRRRRAPLRKTTLKLKPAEPATALGGTVPPGWVVVSPEEARRAQEQRVVRTASTNFAAPATERAGRQAFEAIFGSGTQSTNDSMDLSPVSEKL